MLPYTHLASISYVRSVAGFLRSSANLAPLVSLYVFHCLRHTIHRAGYAADVKAMPCRKASSVRCPYHHMKYSPLPPLPPT